VLFMLTSLGLAITTSKKSSIMEGIKQEQTAPAMPLAPPTQAPAPIPAK
jgi:hypothetical protein